MHPARTQREASSRAKCRICKPSLSRNSCNSFLSNRTLPYTAIREVVTIKSGAETAAAARAKNQTARTVGSVWLEDPG